MKKTYDYLIVGAGLSGAVFAHEMQKIGKKCIVIEKRAHIGGNIYTEEMNGIQVHKYGAHIFHTDNEETWEYMNQFTKFNNFINSPLASYHKKIYNLPFNMNTFYQMWGKSKPSEIEAILENQRKEIMTEPKNLEEQAIKLVGRDIYEKLIKGYSEKQWGRDCKSLPPFIIKRIPLRMTYNNNYFNDRYQGIPIGGYTSIIKKMLHNCEVQLETDYFSNKDKWDSIANKIIFTGLIDEFYEYKFGPLEYRSIRLETEIMDIQNYQGNAVVNFTDSETPYTRIIEHKHFEFGNQPLTVISREYSEEWSIGKEAYYPINDNRNIERYNRYKTLADNEKKVVFVGRLGSYKYFNMDEVIEAALRCVILEDIVT